MVAKNPKAVKETARGISEKYVDNFRHQNPETRNGRKVTEQDYSRLQRTIERTLINLTKPIIWGGASH